MEKIHPKLGPFVEKIHPRVGPLCGNDSSESRTALWKIFILDLVGLLFGKDSSSK